MGRSVSVPSGAICTVYLHDPADLSQALDDDYPDNWQVFIEDLQTQVHERFPSFEPTESWLGREERVVAENAHAMVVVCEYMGVVTVSLVPLASGEMCGLAKTWLEKIEDTFRDFIESRCPNAAMRRVGGMSNGESVYRKT